MNDKQQKENCLIQTPVQLFGKTNFDLTTAKIQFLGRKTSLKKFNMESTDSKSTAGYFPSGTINLDQKSKLKVSYDYLMDSISIQNPFLRKSSWNCFQFFHHKDGL